MFHLCSTVNERINNFFTGVDLGSSGQSPIDVFFLFPPIVMFFLLPQAFGTCCFLCMELSFLRSFCGCGSSLYSAFRLLLSPGPCLISSLAMSLSGTIVHISLCVSPLAISSLLGLESLSWCWLEFMCECGLTSQEAVMEVELYSWCQSRGRQGWSRKPHRSKVGHPMAKSWGKNIETSRTAVWHK